MDSRPLRVRLLGEADISLGDSGGVRFPTRKAMALIAYLSLEGQATRAHLAGLLWSHRYDDLARKNLRQELHRLGASPLGGWLEVTPTHVGLRRPVETDVDQFRACARQGAVEAALDLYGGPLLTGLELRGAAGFDDWLTAWRERLAAERLELLQGLLKRREAGGDLPGALEVARTLIAEDGFHERHHRAAMRLYLALGAREAALQVFERCRAMLEREFALEPLPETQALATQAQRRSVPVVSDRGRPPRRRREWASRAGTLEAAQRGRRWNASCAWCHPARLRRCSKPDTAVSRAAAAQSTMSARLTCPGTSREPQFHHSCGGSRRVQPRRAR